MKISNKMRAQAIHLLDVHASSNFYDLGQASRCLDSSLEAFELAHAAYTRFSGGERVARAAAAGLLRDGWSPGQTIVEFANGAAHKRAPFYVF